MLFLSVGGTNERPDERLAEQAAIVVNRLAEFEQLAVLEVDYH